MLKEEWRMHSELFHGSSFAMFPVMVFFISLTGSYALIELSTLGVNVLSQILGFLGVFMGLSVGAIGFWSRDAMKNVLGPANLLIYSSRTLPVSKTKLLVSFLLMDTVYYTAFFLLPLSAGAFLISGFTVFSGIGLLFGGFIAGLLASLVLTSVSTKLPSHRFAYKNRFGPLVDKTVIDVMRSTGGIMKIIFSLTVLTGLYWFLVLYFPFASQFLQNPVISFGVLIGTVSLTVYNWINRFDDAEEYLYLPVNSDMLLEAKQKAFLLVSIPLTSLFLVLAFLFYPVSYLDAALAILASLSTQIYTVGLGSYLTGLKPNYRLFDSKAFMKYLVANSVFVLPLLMISLFINKGLYIHFFGLLSLTMVAGIFLTKIADSRIET
jgi:hypothetical protein